MFIFPIPIGAIEVNTSCSLSRKTFTCNYVPKDIPDGVQSVHIKDLMLETEDFDVNDGLFQSSSWKNVKYLSFFDHSEIKFYLKERAFTSLTELKGLHIDSESRIQIDPNALLGLNNLNILDFSGCIRLNFDILMNALNGSEKVPNLEKLKLSTVQYSLFGLNIDRKFSRSLLGKPVKILDLSMTHMSVLDFGILTDMDHLKVLNLSRAILSQHVRYDNLTPAKFNDLVLDFSYLTSPKLIIPYHSQTYANINISFSVLRYLDLHDRAVLFYPGILNLTGILDGPDIKLYNINIWNDQNFKTFTKQLIMNENKIHRFDVTFECDHFDFSSLELLALAENGLEYFHPSFLTCLRSLEHLDLSVNNLNAMQEENAQLFGQVLNSSDRLKYINLASNQLVDIPNDFFEGSKNLVTINLAGNKLTQVHFKLHHLQLLSFIDLSDNDIKILDSMTMKQLDAMRIDLEPNIVNTNTKKIASSIRYTSSIRKVRLKGNPFTCDTCETLSSIRWLVSTTITEPSPDELTCKGEDDTNISLTDAVVAVQGICERKLKIIVATITSVVASSICVGVVLFIYFRRKRAQKKRRRYDIIQLLRQANGHFAVFLSFCNEDEIFATENVIGPLNEGLQQLVGTERDLVCRGDSAFRLGQYVHNESLRCIDKSAVFLCIVSNSYCNSRYCVEEFDQATQSAKPVILMMKGDVDIDLMTPAMQLLFRNHVRMLWEEHDGQYRLKTSWENVCESIIDIATD
ncbi:Toll-like receptor 7 [Mactra antiquata]